MNLSQSRRSFLSRTLAGAAALALAPGALTAERKPRKLEFGVAGFSFHRMVRNREKSVLELFALIRQEYDLSLFDLTTAILDPPNLAMVDRLASESRKHGVAVRNILVGGEGPLGAADPALRARAVRYHRKWIDVVADLGGRGIRCNWQGEERGMLGNPDAERAFVARSAEAFHDLLELARPQNVEVMIENHGGASSIPRMMVALMQAVDDPAFGTLPDFGNFPADVDRYDGVDALMPWAKTISAKCYDFGPDGLELSIDYPRMFEIVCDKHGYEGYVHIEYEGPRVAERRGVAPLSEVEGVRACLALLRKLAA